LRALKILVVVMGIMLGVGFAALVVAIATRVEHRKPQTAAAHQPSATPIDIPQGARVEAMTTAPGRLILDFVLPDGNREIAMIDIDTGTLAGTIDLRAVPQTPPASSPAQLRQ